MENASIWEEKTLINELIQGMELTKQLRVHLNAKSSTETRELLLERILSSYDKALLILKWSESIGQPQPQPAAPLTSLPESPVSGDGSPQSGDYGVFKDQADRKVISKKRKVLPTRTEQVRVCSESGLEGNNDDGYSWRKYGQKDILGAKFPRSYYRCTYRNVQDCWATKQVQRTDEDPTVFEITYKGQHTCNQINQSVPPPASPEKHEIKHHHHHYNNHQQQNSDDKLSSLRANLRVNTENLDNNETAPSFSFPSTSLGFFTSENQYFPMLGNGDSLRDYSPSFVSPATSESNYFTESSCQMNDYRWVNDLQYSQSSLTEMISANCSATNSPIGDLAFSTDYVDLDPNFPFTNSEFWHTN